MKKAYKALTTRDERGFTLIELLVVIAIIAVLAALILAALSSAQKGARDSRRKSDLNQYKTALAQYNGDKNLYPTQTPATIASGNEPCTSLQAGNYLSTCLTDPKNTGANVYTYGSANGTDFAACVPLERVTTDWFVVGPTYSGPGAAKSITSASTCKDVG